MSRRAWRLLALVILSKPFGNLFLALGIRSFPALSVTHPEQFIRALFEPMVALGIAMQILWLLSRMTLFGIEDLSFVLPVTAVGYVLTTALGRFFLHEPVSPLQWIAVLLIFLGTALVTGTSRTKSSAKGASAG